MLDIRFVENNLDIVKENCRKRGCNINVEEIVNLEQERRAIIGNLDAVRQEVNNLSKQWRLLEDEEKEQLKVKAQELKDLESTYSDQLQKVEQDLQKKASWLPNLLDPRVPIGTEEDNIVVKEVGEPTLFDFRPRSHDDIGKILDIIDIPRGINTAKSRFYLVKNEFVRMRYALIQMFIDHVSEQGFQLICPPYLAKERTLYTSGYLPFAQKDNFKVSGEDLSLIGTSEQSLLGMHIDEILRELPLLYLGDSMCFRTEVGSAGRDVSGILRVHQFYKLEQIVYCHPDESELWHQKCLENEEWLMEELNIPYRVVLTATHDLAFAGRVKYDTEAWFPSQNRYRETTSNTNLGDFQTRRGMIRFKIDKEKGYPHVISATGFCDRLILAILENYQQANSSVVVPEKLVPYMGGVSIIHAKDK